MRYRAIVAYDGTDFVGWQTQQGRGRTVQETLSVAISTVVRSPVRVFGAGRTDTGVHATGQVISFDCDSDLADLEGVQRSVNGVLPEDVSVRDLAVAAADFDPRRDAVRRAYKYRIWNAPVRSPTERRTSWHVRWPLDVEAMREAAQVFVGEHDFASFQGADKIERPSVRRVDRSDVLAEGSLLTYWIEANAYARHMVRNIVGQIVEVGRGRCTVAGVGAILEARDRDRAAPPAPPQGLYLEWVRYE